MTEILFARKTETDLFVSGPAVSVDGNIATYDGATGKIIKDSGVNISAISGSAPNSASYLVLGLDATLTSERVLTAGTALAFVDGGAGGTLTINVDTAALDALFLTPAEGNAAYQPIDADLTALAALATTGILARTGAGTFATRTITGTALEVEVSNGDGVAGNPTIGLPDAVTITTSLSVPTLNGVTAIDATTENTIEAAIDTLANLTSIQGFTVTLADAGANAFFGWDDVAGAYENLTAAEAEAIIEPLIDTLANLTSIQGVTVAYADEALDVLWGWDDSASTYKNMTLAVIATEAAPANGDFLLLMGAEGDLRKVDWASLPAGGGGAPVGASYVVMALDATLTSERVLTAGAGLTLTDGGVNGNATLDVVAGNTSLTVGANDIVVNLAHAFVWSAAHVHRSTVDLEQYSADTVSNILAFEKSRNATPGSHTIVVSGDNLGQINFSGSNGTTFDVAARIEVFVDGTPGAVTDMPGAIVFYTTPDASATPLERLRIRSTGSIEMRQTSGKQVSIDTYAANASANEIAFRKSRNATVGSHTILSTGDDLGYLAWYASDGTSFISAAQIYADIDPNLTIGIGDIPGRLILQTSADATNGTLKDRMVIYGNANTFIDILSDDAGATSGPFLRLNRQSATPADLDDLGEILFSGRDSAGNTDNYASIKARIVDELSTSEDGRLMFQTAVAGTLDTRFTMDAGFYAASLTDQGAGTVNATNLFVSGTNLTALYQPLDADLTSIAALATTTAGRSTLTVSDDALDEFVMWDDSAGTMKTAALADILTEAAPAAGDFVLIMGAEGDVRKVDWSGLPGGGSFTAATQAEMEAASSTTVGSTPGRQHFHPGHPKVWSKVTYSAGAPTQQVSYNMTSITDTGLGRLTFTIATDFSGAHWCAQMSIENGVTAGNQMSASGAIAHATPSGGQAAGTLEVDIWESGSAASGDLVDPVAVHFVGLGDHV